ncbi:hypothetical protein DL95DRAFT_107387 [Leptodontidium sp. 2 PMI_412]|nr:hypothetical protein DL95DRAFT_107387 [Leptodontidium sp. 2 PMI_412]
MVEERRRERNKHEKEKERRRQLQIESGNRRGGKRGHKERCVGRHITEVNIGPFLSTVYLHQEELFHAIDALLHGWFAAGGRSWSADTRRFKPPPNSPDPTEAWQLVSDQVASVYMLVEGQLYHHANFMLGQVLAGLRVAARVCDPSFIVHFWTICHVLSGVPVRSRGAFPASLWLGWFLRHLKQIFSSAFGQHPLVVIVDSLLKVWASSPRDLKATLGLGHWKAIHTLGGLVGSTHNIVLNMGAHCTKIWKSKFSASSTLVEFLYQPLLTGNAHDLEAEQMAEVSLNYLFAASKEKYNELGVVNEASQLLTQTREICREKAHLHTLQYDSVTRAFVFSLELVATHHLETWKQPEQKQNKQPDRELSYKYMGEAIEILQYGDLQCRIRATSFSKRLSTWIKGHRQKTGNRPKNVAIEEEKKKVLQEKARTRELVRHIAKEPIKGSRRRRLVRGTPRNSPRDGLAVTRDLLLASLLV